MSEEDIEQAEKELQEIFISFERNDIPNFDGRTAYRIFVYGINVKYPDDFKKKYCQR